MGTKFSLPYNDWMARPHQLPLWDYLSHGGKRAIAIWHRRAGKDEICLHHAAVSAATRIGNYAHCLPEFAQGRKAIWQAVNPHSGKRRIDEAFPFSFRDSTNDNEMFIRFKNGSTWSVIGSDRYDNSLVGSSLAGIVFSEYALSNPSAWGYARPMIEESDGWAAFITTPRGRNHAYDLYKFAKQSPRWFAELLTVEDTGALTAEQLAETRAEYQALYGLDHGEAQFMQEYMCDWASALLGSFYAGEMAAVRNEGRILEIEPEAGRPVHWSFDIGVGDDTACWAFQASGSQLLILDCFANSGVGVEWYRDEIAKREKERGWAHGTDYVPHDAKVKEWGTGKTRVETMNALGMSPMLVPMASLEDGRNAVRRTLPLCVFHPRCEPLGIAALEQHRREWDDEKKTFKEAALKDWTIHAADSFRYLAQAWRPAPARVIKLPKPRGLVLPPPPDIRRGARRL